MELLAVIHHPGVHIRPAEEIALDLSRPYDKAMGQPSTRWVHELPFATVILLEWSAHRLAWKSWHEADGCVLATAGLPLLYTPMDEASEMLTPARLARFLGPDGATKKLGCCGGYFASALVTNKNTVRLATNYLGEVPLNRAEHEGVTVWSNKAAAAALLAGVEPRMDTRGALEFILLSHTLDERTLWKGVSLEPPATVIELSARGVTREPYIDIRKEYFAHVDIVETKDDKKNTSGRLQDANLNKAEGSDVRRKLALRTIQSMAPLAEALRDSGDKARLHLSGGADSRAVAAMLRKHDYLPPCLTHNTPNDEVEAAVMVAKSMNLPYSTVPAGEPPTIEKFIELARPSLWQSDGLMSLKYLCGVYDLAYIRDEGYIPIEGLGGEYGRGYYYDNDQNWMLIGTNHLSPVMGKALGGRRELWPKPEMVDLIGSRIQSYFEELILAGLDPFQISTFYYVNQKMRHWATARRNTGFQWMIDPLQMPSWTLPAMASNPKDQQDDKLIRALTAYAWPAADQVPTAADLADALRKKRIRGSIFERMQLKLQDTLKGPPPEHIQTQTLRGMRELFVGEMRKAGPAFTAIIKPDAASEWLDHQKFPYTNTELFWHSLTLAMWTREFVLHKPQIRPARAG